MEHWAKYDPEFWPQRHEDFLWFFFGMCFPEPRSTKPIEDCVGWGLDTLPEVLTAENASEFPTRETVEDWCAGHHLPGPGHPRRPRHDQPALSCATDRRADRRRVRDRRRRRAHPAGPRPGEGQPPHPRLRRARGTRPEAEDLDAWTASPQEGALHLLADRAGPCPSRRRRSPRSSRDCAPTSRSTGWRSIR